LRASIVGLTYAAYPEEFGMTDSGLAPSTAARLVIAPLTMLALVLPPPASCSACSTNEGQFSAESGCCQKHATQPLTDHPACIGGHESRCGCCIQPTDRSARQPDRHSPSIDLSGTLSLATFAPCNYDAAAPSELLQLRTLAHRIPHRILHCSWQI
jgi:hypothetical protein